MQLFFFIKKFFFPNKVNNGLARKNRPLLFVKILIQKMQIYVKIKIEKKNFKRYLKLYNLFNYLSTRIFYRIYNI